MVKCRLGVDIGGTFTDAVLMEEKTGRLHLMKVPSTPSDPSNGYLNVVSSILEASAFAPGSIIYNAHGTTVATNTIIENKGAKVALITTRGFRDIFEIARQIRPKLYDIFCEKPKPLIPRHLCFEIPERLNYAGNVLEPLDESVIHGIVDTLRAEAVEAVVVCLLHSYINPAHERRVGELLRTALPNCYISLSSDLCPEMREYFRASTTAINALVMPVVTRYLQRIEEKLSGAGVQHEVRLMTSSGGMMFSSHAQRAPVQLIESGPAAGVIGATYLAKMAGFNNLISFDMGGTTAKAGLVENGSPTIVPAFEVGSTSVADNRSAGYPVRTPVIDLIEIGAGGGSVAWVDSAGGLHVGPQSSGADPGPACYAKGQTEACITDANVVLGRINPEYFLGGRQKIDASLAHAAIEKLAEQLGLNTLEAANGILDIATAKMASAIRIISVQRGFNPRDFVLVAFGGAGPLHANAIARELGVPQLLIPMSPGVTCALGLLVSDLKHDYTQALIAPLRSVQMSKINGIFDAFIGRATLTLESEGVPRDQISFDRFLDLRYIGQSYELRIWIPDRPVSSDDLDQIESTFFSEHHRSYGFASSDEPVELVNIRLTAIGNIPRPSVRKVPRGDLHATDAQKGVRKVFFSEMNEVAPAAVYDRYRLQEGNVLRGPAIVEEIDSTTVVLPGYQAAVDGFGNLLIEESAHGPI